MRRLGRISSECTPPISECHRLTATALLATSRGPQGEHRCIDYESPRESVQLNAAKSAGTDPAAVMPRKSPDSLRRCGNACCGGTESLLAQASFCGRYSYGPR